MARSDETEPHDGGVRSIARAIDVLALFDTTHPTRTLRDLVAATGLPKTTVVRVCATLEARGLLLRPSETTYAPGPAFLRWAHLAASLWDVSDHTRAMMRELVDQCGETVNVYVRQGTERVSIAQEEGTATVRSVVPLGVPMPLSRGATARVLLTGAPNGLLERLAAAEGLDPEALARTVASTRETGYAFSHGERELGASAVAAPIVAHDGRVLAALSVSGPTSRFTADRIAAYVNAVVTAAQRISDQGLGSVEAFL
ncbi:IclR family transcriptional regulator [Micromonospora sp. NPDC007230]|uniref:IclR family transcriptional regulator n=1 Tax=Micromonospora sp. NPDC007230 TaxID=3364237 RepID=UPI0036BAD194